MSAVRMEVSCRHAQRPQPAPVAGGPEVPPVPLSAVRQGRSERARGFAVQVRRFRLGRA